MTIDTTAILLASLVIAAATLWNGWRSSTVSTLSTQVEALRKEVDALREHCDRCDRQLDEVRSENQFLLRQLRKLDNQPPSPSPIR